MSKAITIQRNTGLEGEVKNFPSSKSISNRALIINALGGNRSTLHNLSDANDTQLMIRHVQSSETTLDVEDAGTTMRFLTAYFSITGQHKVLTGTHRMKERPIAILVDALRLLGADIHYLEKEGFPPVELRGFKGQKTDRLTMRGDVSSQYISAMMMVAPRLPQGLTLTLEGKIGSRPYIEMTLALMKSFGANASFQGNTVQVNPGNYVPTELTIESDWSGAAFWYAFVALAKKADILLPNLSLRSLQGDVVLVQIMENLGVDTTVEGNFIRLRKKEAKELLEWDFTHCPDLAQAVSVVCAAKGIEGRFTGLESLRIKETDRIYALQQELAKIGASLLERGSEWKLVPSAGLPPFAEFETYKDHRMAMAFAALATCMDVRILDPGAVRKSYPKFWNDVKDMGFPCAME